jgi:3-deoxy-D-arabino-heptulosonate 7-phosphate (DAHP) synthase
MGRPVGLPVSTRIEFLPLQAIVRQYTDVIAVGMRRMVVTKFLMVAGRKSDQQQAKGRC